MSNGRALRLWEIDMGLLDGLLGNLNLEDIAGKLGVSPDQIQGLVSQLGEGADLSTLMAKAEEMGLPMDKIQEMLGGGSASDLLGKASDMLGGSGEGLGGMVKGLFGKE